MYVCASVCVCVCVCAHVCVCVCVCVCVRVCVKTSVLAWRQSNQPSCQQTPISLICTNGNSVSLHKRVRLCVHGCVCMRPTSPDCLRFLFGLNRPALWGTKTRPEHSFTPHERWDGCTVFCFSSALKYFKSIAVLFLINQSINQSCWALARNTSSSLLVIIFCLWWVTLTLKLFYSHTSSLVVAELAAGWVGTRNFRC